MENTGHYKWEMLRLTWDRWARCLVTDKFITQFANGFKGSPRDERGLLDAGVSQQYYQEYVKAQGIAHKADGVTNISGNNFQFDADTGNLTIIGHAGNIQILKEDLIKVLSFIMAGPPPDMDVQGKLPDTASQNAYNFSPQLKERQERNLAELERCAKASSQGYPKGR